MNGVSIDVMDKEDIIVNIINKVEIRVINLQLGSYVDVSAVLKDYNRFVKNITLRIEGEEYQQWGNDDTYLENLVLKKLNLTRKPEI